MRIYVYPDFSDNISKCNHLRINLQQLYENDVVIVEGNQEGNYWVRLSTLPNFQIALCGQLSLFHCYIFFPHLRRHVGICESMKWVSNLTSSELEFFYDNLLIPAIKHVCSASILSVLPSTFSTAQKKAQSKNGHFKSLGINVRGDEAREIFRQIEILINERG